MPLSTQRMGWIGHKDVDSGMQNCERTLTARNILTPNPKTMALLTWFRLLFNLNPNFGINFMNGGDSIVKLSQS